MHHYERTRQNLGIVRFNMIGILSYVGRLAAMIDKPSMHLMSPIPSYNSITGKKTPLYAAIPALLTEEKRRLQRFHPCQKKLRLAFNLFTYPREAREHLHSCINYPCSDGSHGTKHSWWTCSLRSGVRSGRGNQPKRALDLPLSNARRCSHRACN